MSADVNTELSEFHQFVGAILNGDAPRLSPEEALDAWRLEHPSAEQYEEDLEAVRRALADMDAGDTGRPVEVFLEEFRKRHNIR
jgi:hypothetical protein